MIAAKWQSFESTKSFRAMERWWYPFGLGLLLSVGALLRLSNLAEIGTDGRYFGGLWVGFIEAIKENSYALPTMIEHITAAGSPYAYPPLSFYAALALSDITGWEPLFFVNVLPGVVSVISLLAFYCLAASITTNKLQRFLVFAAFAFQLNAYHQQHFPSGLSESFGTLALITFAWYLLKMKDSNRQNVAIAGMLGGVAILASPGSAVAMFLTAGAIWLSTSNTRGGLRQSAIPMGIVLGIALVLSSWYWLTVMLRHGPEIFSSTFSDRVGDGHIAIRFAESFVRKLLEFEIGGLEILIGIALIGLVELIRQRRFLVPLWLASMFAVPQESTWLVSIPTAIAIGFGAWSIIRILTDTFDKFPAVLTKAAVAATAIGLLLILPLIEIVDSEIEVLSAAEIDLIEAARSRSDEGDLFLVVASDGNFLEWFPFIADRTVLNERWGAEFTLRSRELDSINGELRNCETVSCVAQTDLLGEGNLKSRRFLVIRPEIVVDGSEYSILFTNAAGSIIELPRTGN